MEISNFEADVLETQAELGKMLTIFVISISKFTEKARSGEEVRGAYSDRLLVSGILQFWIDILCTQCSRCQCEHNKHHSIWWTLWHREFTSTSAVTIQSRNSVYQPRYVSNTNRMGTTPNERHLSRCFTLASSNNTNFRLIPGKSIKWRSKK